MRKSKRRHRLRVSQPRRAAAPGRRSSALTAAGRASTVGRDDMRVAAAGSALAQFERTRIRERPEPPASRISASSTPPSRRRRSCRPARRARRPRGSSCRRPRRPGRRNAIRLWRRRPSRGRSRTAGSASAHSRAALGTGVTNAVRWMAPSAEVLERCGRAGSSGGGRATCRAVGATPRARGRGRCSSRAAPTARARSPGGSNPLQSRIERRSSGGAPYGAARSAGSRSGTTTRGRRGNPVDLSHADLVVELRRAEPPSRRAVSVSSCEPCASASVEVAALRPAAQRRSRRPSAAPCLRASGRRDGRSTVVGHAVRPPSAGSSARSGAP